MYHEKSTCCSSDRRVPAQKARIGGLTLEAQLGRVDFDRHGDRGSGGERMGRGVGEVGTQVSATRTRRGREGREGI